MIERGGKAAQVHCKCFVKALFPKHISPSYSVLHKNKYMDNSHPCSLSFPQDNHLEEVRDSYGAGQNLKFNIENFDTFGSNFTYYRGLFSKD